jgi:hypothetical protein
MKFNIDKFSVLLKGPLDSKGNICFRRFNQSQIDNETFSLGPLLLKKVYQRYSGYGLDMYRVEITNCWGADLFLHTLSAKFSLPGVNKSGVCRKERDRIIITKEGYEYAVFFPPHYWNDGYFRISGNSLKAVFFQAEEKMPKPILLVPGRKLVFRILLAEKGTGKNRSVAEKKIWKYLQDRRFRKLSRHKIMISHMHTEYSDGQGTVIENARYLKEAGIQIGLWTDHDTYLTEQGIKNLKKEVRTVSDKNFLAVFRPELSSNLRSLPRQKGRLPDHGCYFTPEPVMHFGSRRKNKKLYPAEGAVDVVAETIVKKDKGVCWLAHPALSRQPEELLKGWTKNVIMLEWSNWEWVTSKHSAVFKYQEDFGRLFFEKLDMLLKGGYRVGLISGVDFHSTNLYRDVYNTGVVNYLKDVEMNEKSITGCLKRRDFFVSTGEILIKLCTLNRKNLCIELDTIFPLERIRVVTDRGSYDYLPGAGESSEGKFEYDIKSIMPEKWWRAEFWDIAGNPAFSQPVFLHAL